MTMHCLLTLLGNDWEVVTCSLDMSDLSVSSVTSLSCSAVVSRWISVAISPLYFNIFLLYFSVVTQNVAISPWSSMFFLCISVSLLCISS